VALLNRGRRNIHPVYRANLTTVIGKISISKASVAIYVLGKWLESDTVIFPP
jgi:hypothetical protein